MSNDVNLFTPLVDSLVDAGKIASNHIKKILGLSTLDFRKLFEELNIQNYMTERIMTILRHISLQCQSVYRLRTLRSIQKQLRIL